MTRKLFAAVALAAVVSAGCFDLSKSSAAPSGSGSLLAGSWTSASPGTGLDTCTNFLWSVTEYTGSTGAGTFSATCFGNIQVAGNARGTLTSPSLVSWTLTATANGPGLPASCPVALSGTATLTAQNITIPYSGTVCGAPVSGTEILKKS
jgi:hypothetical protein